MPPLPSDPVVSETTPRKHFHIRKELVIGLIVSFILFIAVLAGLHFLTPALQQTTDGAPVAQNTDEQQGADAPSGTIYLSLAPKDAEGNPGKVGIYTYQIGTGDLSLIIGSDVADNLTPTLSPDGTMIAFTQVDATDEVDILYGDSGLAKLVSIPLPEGTEVARNPVWSPDGTKIAFTSRLDGDGSEMGLDDWRVHVFDTTTGSIAEVARGTNPLYLPDGSLLVLRNEGIVRYADDGSNSVVIPMFSGKAAANMKIDISQDGTQIALAAPEESRVYVSKVSSWSPFQATTRAIDTPAFWPVFSPDGKYLTMEVFTWGEGRTVENYYLATYSLTDNTWLDASFDLSPFYQEALFITEWR
jgi:Tol biopolymer transport system component